MKVVIILGLLQQSRGKMIRTCKTYDCITKVINNQTNSIVGLINEQIKKTTDKNDDLLTEKFNAVTTTITNIMNVNERYVNVTAREKAVTEREELVGRKFNVIQREQNVTAREEAIAEKEKFQDFCLDVTTREEAVIEANRAMNTREKEFQDLEAYIIKNYIFPTYERVQGACVPGKNIKLIPNLSKEECAFECKKNSKCEAFEYFNNYKNFRRRTRKTAKVSATRGATWQNLGESAYEEKDCQLNSASDKTGCSGYDYNLDLYIDTEATKKMENLFAVWPKNLQDLLKTTEK